MKASLQRAAIVTVATFVAYLIYGAVAAPMIEPQLVAGAPRGPSGSTPAPKVITADRSMLRWFGSNPQAWELHNPKRLQNEQGVLLFNDYKTLDDGRVKIFPCTLVFLPKDVPAGDERDRQAVILQAPQGAVLRFDKPFDLVRSSKPGKIEGGLLVGRITIRSEGKSRGPEDDLFVSTYDVDLTPTTITTPHPVQFRWGPNTGSGRELHIELADSDDKQRNAAHGFSGGVESFALRRDVVMDLLMADAFSAADRIAGVDREEQPPEPNSAGDDQQRTPIKVACKGPFQFDFVERLATFEDRVDVLRINPGAQSDQLLCERLSIAFEKRAADAAGGDSHLPMGRMKARRFEARGQPVVITAPSSSVYAKGERLEYDLDTGRISLEARQEAVFRYEVNEIHAQQLHYQPGEEGRVGRFLAAGEGWLQWRLPPEQPGQAERSFDASWSRQLHSRPHENRQVISLEGKASTHYSAVGRLKADEIHAWLFETLQPARPLDDSPPATNKNAGGLPTDKLRSKLEPDRLLAIGSVEADSPQLTAETAKLEVWFKSPPEGAAPLAIGGRHGGNSATSPSGAAPGPLAGPPLGPAPPNFAAAAGPAGSTSSSGFPDLLRGGSNGAGKRPQRFDVRGDLIQVELLLGEPLELAEVRVAGSARLSETLTPTAADRPLQTVGDVIHALRANQPTAAVEISGKPAHLEGRGLSMTGEKVILDRGQNHVNINGPGVMVIVTDRDLNGQPGGTPKPLEIRWQDQMHFDGRTARFAGQVAVRREHERLDTQTMEIVLTQRVDFNQMNQAQRPQLERILCREGVNMQRQVHDELGLASLEWMQLRDLSITQSSGAIYASGPGWIRRVGRGQPTTPLGSTLPTVQPKPAPGQAEGLSYLYVEFQKEMTGNIHRRQIVFHKQVHVTYGPVKDWHDTIDADRPEGLGPQGAVLEADEMTVAETVAADGAKSLDFQAVGNALVEGQTFTAQAQRIAYTQAKELLVMEGGPRNHAELWRQAKVGAAPTYSAARMIKFFRGEPKRVEVIDARYVDVGQLPGKPLRKPR